MKKPLGYTYAIDDGEIKTKWPNLKQNKNFSFTSLRTDILTELTPNNYNCVAWAIGITDKWMDMPNFFQDYFDLDPETLDHTVYGYAGCLKHYGFEICENDSVEEDILKIAIFGDLNDTFMHASRQLPDGSWTSKMGDWEDIKHKDLEAITGTFYGSPKIYMKKPIDNL